MTQYDEKQSGCLKSFLTVFCLLAAGGIAAGLLYWRHEMQQVKAPSVSAGCSGIRIYQTNSMEYILSADYLFSNTGDTSVTFAECFDTAAFLDGKECRAIVPDGMKNMGADDTVMPGRNVVIEVCYSMTDFIPKHPADISLRLYDRYQNGELIEQTDKSTSGIKILSESDKCINCYV